MIILHLDNLADMRVCRHDLCKIPLYHGRVYDTDLFVKVDVAAQDDLFLGDREIIMKECVMILYLYQPETVSPIA